MSGLGVAPDSPRRGDDSKGQAAWCRVVAAALAVVLAAAPAGAADGPTTAPDPTASDPDVAPTYCGVYAVYGALRSLGLPVDFRSLVRPTYIGSTDGSSLAELEAAVADHGGFADRGVAMTVGDLEASEWPVILHTSTDIRPTVYNHWSLFLGVEGGMAKVIDASEGPGLIPFPRLLARWDTIGIVVADRPIRGSLGLSRAIMAAWVAALLLVIALLKGRMRANPGWRNRVALPIAGIVSGSILLGLGYHLASRDGLLANPDAVRLIRCARFPKPIPVVSADDLEPIVRSKSATLIDARFPSDYRLGHLPDAISVPVTSSRRRRESLLKGIAKGDPIVVYCQSESCPFDDTLGEILVAEGYTDVRTYVGGWVDWSKRHHQ